MFLDFGTVGLLFPSCEYSATRSATDFQRTGSEGMLSRGLASLTYVKHCYHIAQWMHVCVYVYVHMYDRMFITYIYTYMHVGHLYVRILVCSILKHIYLAVCNT